MAKCKVCGKQIPRGNVMCNDCTEALRMQVPPTEDEVTNRLKSIMSKPYVKEATYDYNKRIYTCKLQDDSVHKSADGKGWYKDGSLARETEPWAAVQAAVMQGLMDDPWGDATPTQRKIREIIEAMKDLLLYKNQKYGDSAINPEKIFYKGDSTSSILIRLNDKIGRVKANPDDKPRVNDVCDIIGYCILLLISMGITAEDIAKFKD